jgi:hypothetical protein
MYDLKILLTYFLLGFGIILLAFPDYVQKFLPNNDYTKKMIEYKQSIAISSIVISVYLYLSEKQSSEITSTEITSSLPDTISSSLVTPTTSELPTFK